MITLAWVLNSYANSLALLYIGAIFGGIGAGSVYGTCVGNALKWFPDHRGFAAGSTAAGFGAGAALTVVPIAHMIAASGYQQRLLHFRHRTRRVVFLLAFFLRKPSQADACEEEAAQSAANQRSTSRRRRCCAARSSG